MYEVVVCEITFEYVPRVSRTAEVLISPFVFVSFSSLHTKQNDFGRLEILLYEILGVFFNTCFHTLSSISFLHQIIENNLEMDHGQMLEMLNT